MRLSNLLSPRAVVIAVLIGISSISFALGFFVGKLRHVEPASNGQMGQVGPAAQEQVGPAAKEQVGPAAQGQLGHSRDYAVSETDDFQNTPLPEKQGSVYDVKPSEGRSSTYYTVQVGAFKTGKDAAVMKKRLLSRGYEVYISEKDGIHRVRAGRFKERKQADVLALKIKKTEGVDAFVTTD